MVQFQSPRRSLVDYSVLRYFRTANKKVEYSFLSAHWNLLSLIKILDDISDLFEINNSKRAAGSDLNLFNMLQLVLVIPFTCLTPFLKTINMYKFQELRVNGTHTQGLHLPRRKETHFPSTLSERDLLF